MADDIDRAQNEVDRSLAEAMRMRKPTGPVANGQCHYCHSLLEPGRRWCDSICRDEWEAENR